MKKILFCLLTITFLMLPIVAKAAESSAATQLNIADLGTITFWPTKVNNLGELITVIINWMLGLMGALAVVAVVYSGLMYISASADPTKAETAKKNLTWAIIGIILVALSFVIVQIVAKLVSGK